jgi:hypothetical protein
LAIPGVMDWLWTQTWLIATRTWTHWFQSFRLMAGWWVSSMVAFPMGFCHNFFPKKLVWCTRLHLWLMLSPVLLLFSVEVFSSYPPFTVLMFYWLGGCKPMPYLQYTTSTFGH